MKIQVREAADAPDNVNIGDLWVRKVSLGESYSDAEAEKDLDAALREMGRGWRRPALDDALYCMLQEIKEHKSFDFHSGYRTRFCIFTTPSEYDKALDVIEARVRESLTPEQKRMMEVLDAEEYGWVALGCVGLGRMDPENGPGLPCLLSDASIGPSSPTFAWWGLPGSVRGQGS